MFHIFLFLFFLFIFFSSRYNHKNNIHETFQQEKEKNKKFEFNPHINGYLRIGTFLLQWGLCNDGGGGEIVAAQKNNPVLFPLPLIMYIGAGLTLDMIDHRLGWETGVRLNVDFDEIYGAHAIPYGEKPTIYENIRVIKAGLQEIKFRTSSYHSPFFWFAYGLKV